MYLNISKKGDCWEDWHIIVNRIDMDHMRISGIKPSSKSLAKQIIINDRNVVPK